MMEIVMGGRVCVGDIVWICCFKTWVNLGFVKRKGGYGL